MAATIIANPKTLTVPTWGIPRSTVVTWNTGNDAIKGTVFLTIVDKTTGLPDVTDQLFDDGATGLIPPQNIGTNPAGARNGKRSQQVESGKAYYFRLKQVGKTGSLADATVEVDEKHGLPASLVTIMLQRIPKNQGITNLRVNPGIDTVRIRFKTRQPTIPIIDITDALTGIIVGLVLPIGGTATQIHDYTFQPRSGLAVPLAQETDFSYHITAPSMPGAGVNKAAEESGLFRSGFRNVQVFFDTIDVHDDGDPGTYLGAGDFYIHSGAGDVDTQETLALAPKYGRAEISTGESAGLDRSVLISHAPPRLWVQVKSFEDDGVFSNFTSEVSFQPEGSDWHEVDACEVTTVTRYFDLADASQLPVETPFLLETGPKHVNFTVHGRLNVEAQNGVRLQANVSKQLSPRKPIRLSATLSGLGERVVLGEGSLAQQIQLTPDGRVYCSLPADKNSRKGLSWICLTDRVSGPLTVAAAGKNLHLLMVSADGRVQHKAFVQDRLSEIESEGHWRSLGGRDISVLAATVVRDRVELFALDTSGQVFRHQLTNPPTEGWQGVGEGISGSLNAFTTPRGEIVVLGIGMRGEVLYQYWSQPDAVPDELAWKSLDKAPAGELSADFIDDTVAITSLAEDETVSLALWRNFPDVALPLDWRAIGTLNSLINSRFSLLAERRRE